MPVIKLEISQDMFDALVAHYGSAEKAAEQYRSTIAGLNQSILFAKPPEKVKAVLEAVDAIARPEVSIQESESDDKAA